MLVIRFQRVGRKNDPAFRIVVTAQRSKPKGSGIEMLGSYHPKTKQVTLNEERILYWISNGTKVSDTVYNLLVKKGMIKGAKGKRSIVSPAHTVDPLAEPQETAASVAVNS